MLCHKEALYQINARDNFSSLIPEINEHVLKSSVRPTVGPTFSTTNIWGLINRNTLMGVNVQKPTTQHFKNLKKLICQKR